MEGRSPNGLMSARGTVLPIAGGCSPDPVRRAAQTRSRAGIDVSVPHAVARRARPVPEIVEVGRPDGLL